MTDDVEIPEPTEDKAAAKAPAETVEGADALPAEVPDGNAADFEEADADKDEEKD